MCRRFRAIIPHQWIRLRATEEGHDTSHVWESRPVQLDSDCISGCRISLATHRRNIHRPSSRIGPIRTRCQTLLCFYAVMWDIWRYSRKEPWLDGKGYRDIAVLKQMCASDQQNGEFPAAIQQQRRGTASHEVSSWPLPRLKILILRLLMSMRPNWSERGYSNHAKISAERLMMRY